MGVKKVWATDTTHSQGEAWGSVPGPVKGPQQGPSILELSLALQKEPLPPTPLPASRDNGRQTRPSEGSHAWERPWKKTQEEEQGA